MKTIIRRVGIVVRPSRPYDRGVARAVAVVGAELGWDWLLVPSEAGPALAEALLAGHPMTPLDGVIGCFADAPGTMAMLGPGVPTVDVSPASAGAPGARVAGDDAAVGRVAAAHLLSLGLAHYGYFGWRDGEDSRARERGFAGTVEAAGHRCDAFHWPAGDRDAAADGEPTAALGRWVAALGRPAGVFAGDDRRALQVMAVCRRLGLAVPGDVAVLGVGNDEVFCEIANPSLSSVALATREIGYGAARALEGMMSGWRPAEAVTLVAPVGVVPRRSTGLEPIVDAEVAAAVRYIALNAKDGLQVADVLREAQVSRRTLDQHFIAAVGRTAAQEIARVRLELAKRSLAETRESMERVAAMAGFSDAKQLGLTFRRATGTTPTSYRRQHGR